MGAMMSRQASTGSVMKRYSSVRDLPGESPLDEAAGAQDTSDELALRAQEEMRQQLMQEQLEAQHAVLQQELKQQLEEHLEQQQEQMRQQLEMQRLQQEQVIQQQREQLWAQEELQKQAQEQLEGEKKKQEEQRLQLQEQQDQLQKQMTEFQAQQDEAKTKPQEVPFRTLPPKNKSRELRGGVAAEPLKSPKDKLPSLELGGGRSSPSSESGGGGGAVSSTAPATSLHLPPLAAPLSSTLGTPGGGAGGARRSRSMTRSSMTRLSASTPALTGVVRSEQDEVNDLREQLHQEVEEHQSTTGKVKDLERQLRILQAKQRKHSPQPRPPKKFGIASAAPYAKEQPLPPKVPEPKNNKAFFLPALRSLPQAPPKEERQKAEAEAAVARQASMSGSGPPMSRQSKSQGRIEAIAKLDQMGMNTWQVRRAEKVARLQDLHAFSSGMWDSFFDWQAEDNLA